MVKGKRSCSWNNVLSTQYHYRLYFVTVLVIDRLRRRRFVCEDGRAQRRILFITVDIDFFSCLLFATIYDDMI